MHEKPLATKDCLLQVRVPAELREELQRQAAETDRSVSSVVRLALRDQLAQTRPDPQDQT